MKRAEEEKKRSYRPIRQSQTRYSTEPSNWQKKVEAGSSDSQHHEYGKTCKQRWAVDVRLPELGDGTVAVCLFRKRRSAMRTKGRASMPKLVTL